MRLLICTDRILIKLFAHAKNKHQQRFHNQGKAINDKVRLYSAIGHALLHAKDNGENAFDAIAQVMPWPAFVQSITEADQLARPGSFDHLHLVSDQFSTLRRYTQQFLAALNFHAVAAAQPVLDAIDTLRAMHAANARVVPADAPTTFIRPRWRPLVFNARGIDRRLYEICALSELKNALRSGDIWVEGSRQFRNFDDYLMSGETFKALAQANRLPIAVKPDGEQYLEERLGSWKTSWPRSVGRLATTNCRMPR